nr:hypothetical protein B0A51_10213 [Rachicladosporium sp. CCFEE 5018]
MSATQASEAIAKHTSGPTPSFQSAYPVPLRPSYFIARPDGIFIPLIPVDELPPHIRLRGFGRPLSYQDTFGMQYVGTLPYTGKCYDFETGQAVPAAGPVPTSLPTHSRIPSAQCDTNGRQFLAPDAMVRLGIGMGGSVARVTTPTPLHQTLQPRPVSAAALATNWRKSATDSIEKTQATIDAILSANATARSDGSALKPSLPASGTAPDQEKKVYCTHWIRHGECDYTQQGCLYKHEMPDKATLESIGFRTVPRWYLEKTAPKLEGMSSKPTVGLPMRAAEWLRPSDDSDSDVGDDNSISELSVGSDDEAENKTHEATDVEHEPAESKPSPAFSFELVSAPSGTPVGGGCRKLPPGGDLIDFEPDLTVSTFDPQPFPPPSTQSISSSSSVQSSPRENSASPSTVRNYLDSRPRPRKVFVPAGESPEQHIAEARVRFTRTCGTEEICPAVAEPTVSTRIVDKSTVVPEQTRQLAAASRKDGMMASKHAPPSPSETGLSGSKSLKVLTRRRSSWNGLNRPSAGAASQPADLLTDYVVDKSLASQQTAFLVRMRNGDELAARRRKPVGWRERSKAAMKAVKPPAATDMAKLKSS